MTVVTLAQLEHSSSMSFRLSGVERFRSAVMMIVNPSYCCFYSRFRTTADHFDIYGIWKKVILLLIRLLIFNFRWIFFSYDCSMLVTIWHSSNSQFGSYSIASYEVYLNVFQLKLYLQYQSIFYLAWKMLFNFCFSEISGILWSLRYRLRSSQG